MIAPVQAATVPDKIRVLPKLRSIWMPRPTVRRPANSTPIPPINNTTIIKFTPGCARNTRKPPRQRYRHIVHTANGQMWAQFPQKTPLTHLNPAPKRQLGTPSFFCFAAIVALHQEN
ncbi:MAG TPA: hypothetical protein VK635_12390 [Bradyrhizobium sp.]|jgi:hypothetical protein|nr:hypothetical protein [Bradyrhizobium sp.]